MKQILPVLVDMMGVRDFDTQIPKVSKQNLIFIFISFSILVK